MSKYNFTTKTTYFQKARFFRKSGTNEFAYCIEPFSFFQDNSSYESTLTPYNLTQSQIDRISKIAHFGYGYKNHTDVKWYAITQMMIWQASDLAGNYYFTDSLNGNAINIYLDEMNEINNLVNSYNVVPSISNNTYTIVENHSLLLKDQNNVLNLFQVDDNRLKIENNQLTISNLKEGNYEFNLSKQESIYNKPYIFYQSNNSQNLIETGDIDKINTKITVKVIKTEIEITKIDQDTQTIESKGEAKLDGAVFTLYDENNIKINDYEIINNQIIINNLDFGKYYLKETTPGEGYTINPNIYEINISKENNKISQIIENKVIEKKITIIKKYGENNEYQNEKNIMFNVINKKGDIISTITTDSEGKAEITLPYGEYELVQINTTDGYSKVDPIKIHISSQEDEIIELRDFKIPVPNTHVDGKNLWQYILQIILLMI